MPEIFDVVAIGTGSAASGVASRCRKAGWRVAVVDSRPFGGTCALRGCDPKKVLVGEVVVDEASGRILGAHLLGHNAEELVNLFALAIRKGLTAADLRETLYAYPTHASNVQYML